MSRNVVSSYGVGHVTPGEGTYLHAPIWGGGFRRNGTQRFIQITHGHGGLASQQVSAYYSLNYVMGELVRQGWVAGAGDFGGTAAWAKDSSLAAMLDLYAYATAAGPAGLGCLPTIDGAGWSMGGLGLLNRIKRSPALFRRAVVFAPALQIKTYHDRNPAGYGVEIEAAYGGSAAWQANLAGHEPLLEPNAYRDLGVPIRIYHGDADTTAPIQDSRDFVAAVNRPDQIALHELPGRDHVNLFADVNPDDAADFLEGKVPA